MNISPATLSIPTTATSVNPATEQLARDNRTRYKILPTNKLNDIDAERPVAEQEIPLKRLAEDAEKQTSHENVKQKAPPDPPNKQTQQGGEKPNPTAETQPYLTPFASKPLHASGEIIAYHYEHAVAPHGKPDLDLLA